MHKLSILVVALALLLTPAFAQTQIHSAGQSTPLGVWTIGANPGNRYARYSRAGRVAPPTAIAPIASH